MFDHISIGVRDIAKTKKFYDAAFQPLGYNCLDSGDAYVAYGAKKAQLWFGQTDHPVKADTRSGLHFCFTADTRDAVDKFFAAAIAAGGKDNGPPGIRPDYTQPYYAAFVIDPDGYRIEAYCGKKA